MPSGRAISFVTVHFSGELEHNLLRSPCVRDPGNELVVVDNRGNLFFDSLSAAFREGARRARNKLVVLVHEDVLLPEGWQAAFEAAIEALQGEDPDWGIAGIAGWDFAGSMKGCWTDPYGHHDLMGGASHVPVRRIDELLMAFRADRPPPFDGELPGIHNAGHDLALALAGAGRRAYVLDAHATHKHADAEGKPIRTREDSPKIVARGTLSWMASRGVSDDYFFHKWPGEDGAPRLRASPIAAALVEAPVVLLGRGGGGTRLLGVAAADAGLFIGAEVNASSDTLEMACAVYKAVLVSHRESAPWQRQRAVDELRGAAGAMLARAGFPARWGFKLPESLLALDLIATAFPRARYAHLLRDPLATCLRRTHMTARLDNEIGQAALRAAYRAGGREVARVLDDPPALRMAYTTRHQLDLALAFGRGLPGSRWKELRFELMVADPQRETERLARWLGLAPTGSRLQREVDPARAAAPSVIHPAAEAVAAEKVLAGLRGRLGYTEATAHAH